MTTPSDDPERKKAAIKLAAGPAGEILSKFAAHYTKAILFGEKPVRDSSSTISNGSVTLVRLPKRNIAVTCWHVIEQYRNFLYLYKRVIAQIGDSIVDPLKQLVDESKSLDLAVLDLTDKQVREITTGGEIGSRFVDGKVWPPKHVAAGEVVVLSGFPGKHRQVLAFNEIEFRPFCAAGIQVHSAHESHFACQFEREYWVKSFGQVESNEHLERLLGGMSGGPAFVDRGLNWEFGGFIYEHSPEFDILFLRPATLINPDGTIRKHRSAHMQGG
jgi:hypothetical protein